MSSANYFWKSFLSGLKLICQIPYHFQTIIVNSLGCKTDLKSTFMLFVGRVFFFFFFKKYAFHFKLAVKLPSFSIVLFKLACIYRISICFIEFPNFSCFHIYLCILQICKHNKKIQTNRSLLLQFIAFSNQIKST